MARPASRNRRAGERQSRRAGLRRAARGRAGAGLLAAGRHLFRLRRFDQRSDRHASDPGLHRPRLYEVTGAALLATMGVFNFIGTTSSGWLADKFDNRWLLFIYYGLRGLSLLYLPFSFVDFYTMTLFAVFYGLDWFATVSPTVRMLTNTFGREKAGMVYGWVFTAHQLGGASAAFFGGLLRVRFGGYMEAFMLSGALCLGAAIAVLFIGGRASRRSGPRLRLPPRRRKDADCRAPGSPDTLGEPIAVRTPCPPSSAPPAERNTRRARSRRPPARSATTSGSTSAARPELDHARRARQAQHERLARARAQSDFDRHLPGVRHRPARAASAHAAGQHPVGLHLADRSRHDRDDQRHGRAEKHRDLAPALLLLHGGVEPGVRRHPDPSARRRPQMDHARRSRHRALAGRDQGACSRA